MTMGMFSCPIAYWLDKKDGKTLQRLVLSVFVSKRKFSKVGKNNQHNTKTNIIEHK
jgi:hypothetical protein